MISSNKKKICFITGSRAEYGLIEKIVELFSRNKSFKTYLVVTGSHLNKKFGTTVFAIHPGNTKSAMNPGGYIESDNCAKLIIDLITTKSELNGKFVNLLGKEIFW